ncbi:hypothetical protein CBA19CS11_29310 [Caballeronia novacaledonica]|uniref:hypothetical protein n=1 Tax=Caballeronia novacaledonica TaxID=1544861 RepID=UPI001EE254F8|nr:hypothetical protein [Caballeronia novacaledonica]GJH13022.1 hypothetical protein CBA19CS11_29310 [Caballeronia novacaledonica]
MIVNDGNWPGYCLTAIGGTRPEAGGGPDPLEPAASSGTTAIPCFKDLGVDKPRSGHCLHIDEDVLMIFPDKMVS